MNSIWNKNRDLFKTRFPALAGMLADTIAAFEGGSQDALPLRVEAAKNGSPTASEGGTMLHSKYNPEREAEQAVSAFKEDEEEAAVNAMEPYGHMFCQISRLVINIFYALFLLSL